MEGIQQPACDVSFPERNNSFQDDDDIISTEDREETIHFESISGKTKNHLTTWLFGETLAMDPIE